MLELNSASPSTQNARPLSCPTCEVPPVELSSKVVLPQGRDDAQLLGHWAVHQAAGDVHVGGDAVLGAVTTLTPTCRARGGEGAQCGVLLEACAGQCNVRDQPVITGFIKPVPLSHCCMPMRSEVPHAVHSTKCCTSAINTRSSPLWMSRTPALLRHLRTCLEGPQL